jgi:site-specific DNA-cytosine methylase
MLMIELFSGSKIVSSRFENAGFVTWSVDSNNLLKPDICCDILDLNYSTLPGSVDFLWASPNCKIYSRAAQPIHFKKHNIGYRRYYYEPISNDAIRNVKLLYKVFSIIDHCKPKYWIIENPVGRMRHMEIVKVLASFRFSVNYKDFGFDYSKETDLFCNFDLPLPKSVPLRVGKGVQSVSSRFARSVVPPDLVDFIINYLKF